MDNAISRTQLLRGDFFGRSRPIRPPWSLPENEFVERCTRCGDCISDCPQHILDKGRGGFPQVDFSRGECLFCGECVQTCTTGVLAGRSPQGEGPAPWSVRARIGKYGVVDWREDCWRYRVWSAAVAETSATQQLFVSAWSSEAWHERCWSGRRVMVAVPATASARCRRLNLVNQTQFKGMQS